jgi:ankyrin repeat protein
VNAKNVDGETPLMIANKSEYKREIQEILKDNGANE